MFDEVRLSLRTCSIFVFFTGGPRESCQGLEHCARHFASSNIASGV